MAIIIHIKAFPTFQKLRHSMIFFAQCHSKYQRLIGSLSPKMEGTLRVLGCFPLHFFNCHFIELHWIHRMLLNSHSTCLDMKLQSFFFILRKTFHFQSQKFRSHIPIKVATIKFLYGLTPVNHKVTYTIVRWTLWK